MTSHTPYSQDPTQEGRTESFNVQRLFIRYLKKWPWFLLSVGIMALAAYVFLLYKQPLYTTQARLLIQDEKTGYGQDDVLKELEVPSPKKIVENEIETLRSFMLMYQVVEKLNLNIRYYEPWIFGKREIYNESPIKLIVEEATPELYEKPLELSFPNSRTVKIGDQTYPLNQNIRTSYGKLKISTVKPITDSAQTLFIEVTDPGLMASIYLDKLKAWPTSKTSSVILLSFNDNVADRGDALLNQLIEEYHQASIENKNKAASNTLNFIQERLSIVSGELSKIEKGVEQYKSSQGITDLSSQAQSHLNTLQQNDGQLGQIDIQLATLDDLQRYLNSQPESRGSTPATLGLNNSTLEGQIQAVSQLEIQRAHLARTTSEQNPMLLSLDSQIKITKSNISENIRTMKDLLIRSRQHYQEKNKEVAGLVRTIPQKERALLDITRQQSIKNSLYTYLLQKREETAVAFAAAIPDSRIIDQVYTVGPILPDPKLTYAYFCLFGLMLPIGLMVGKDALNNRVIRRGDVEGVTAIPILGEIVENRKPGTFIISPHSHSVAAEQIRMLRTNLQYLRQDTTKSQVLLFTSSISGEGKSFISLNVGASFSLVDQPTVILEMDLRRPKLTKLLNLDNTVGISNYLMGEATLDEIIQPVFGYTNYFIIPSGTLPPNPSELLCSPNVRKLIHELRERFKYILIDTPPSGLVTDAQLVAPLADATLFLVRHDVTPKDNLKTINLLYHSRQFNNINIILNGVSEDNFNYNSFSYYNYNQGYNQTEKKKGFLSR